MKTKETVVVLKEPHPLHFPASGNNNEIFREIMVHLKNKQGSGMEKAAFVEGLFEQAKQITKGSFEATKIATTDGANLYGGRGPHILVITKDGKIYSGLNTAYKMLKSGLVEIDYSQLKEVK